MLIAHSWLTISAEQQDKMDERLRRNQKEGRGCFSSSLDQCEDREEGVSPSEARLCGGDEGQSKGHRVALKSSEVPSGPSAQQHQPQLDSIFQLLEENIVSFVKTELKKIQKVLSLDGSESLRDEDEEQRSSREALMKMILNFLRRMKQEELAERLQSNVQQMLPIKMEALKETSHDVDLQVPESSYIKEEVEEVLIGQEEKKSSAASFPVSTTSIKGEDNAETTLFDDCPTNRSTHWMKGITANKDFRGDESTWNPHLYTGVEISNSSETEIFEDMDTSTPIFGLKRYDSDSSDSEQESRASVAKGNDISESLISSDCGEQVNKHSLKRQKTQGCSTKKYRNVKKTVDSQNIVETKPASFTCDDCGKIFDKKQYLNRHKRIHSGEKPFSCDLCENSFLQKAHLEKHRRIHTGEKPFRCDVCGHSFSQKFNLDQHKRIHTGEKPFHCDFCGQNFGQKFNLEQHKRIHTGEKPFRCDHCGHSFSHKFNLEQHKRIHTGERPFCCGFCGRSFNRKSCLDRHLTIHVLD